MCHTVLQLCVNVDTVVGVRKKFMPGFVKINSPRRCVQSMETCIYEGKGAMDLLHSHMSSLDHILWKELLGLHKMNATLQNTLIVSQ